MAYSEILVERISAVFKNKRIKVDGKKFMGGYCFFMNEKMCVGLDIDKKTNSDRLMARIGTGAMEEAMMRKGCREMDITGRPMKGFVFVDPIGFKDEKDLEYWIQLSADHNPSAKSSKKKK
jgi:hypothetical protein